LKNPNSTIEELFKNTFENYEAEVNPNAWSNIQNNLNRPAEKIKTDDTSSSAARWALAAAVLALAFLGIWYFAQEEKNTLVETGKDVAVTVENIAPVIKEEVVIPSSNNTVPEKKTENIVKEVRKEKLPVTENNSVVVTKVEDVEHIENKTLSKLEVSNPWLEPSVKKLMESQDRSEKKNKTPYLNELSDELRASIIATPMEGRSPLTVSLQNFYAGLAKTNIWDFGDGSPLDSSSFRVNHTYDEPGVYTVILTVRNETGKVGSTGTKVNVDKTSTLDLSKIVNTFSPNDDGANDIFYIKGESLKSINVAIYDVNENILYSWNTLDGGWDGKTHSGDLVQEGRYAYVLNATGADGRKYTHKGLIIVDR